jgi:hypothetical protein
MTEDRISTPVTRIDTQRDRPSDTSHYQAIERARDGGRRQPRHRQPAETLAPTRPGAPSRQATPPAGTLRGTHVDVIV